MPEAGEIKLKLTELVTPAIIRFGCELLDVEFTSDSGQRIVRFVIDKPDGVTMDDCAEVSTAIDPLLDNFDLLTYTYNLEVSSPGIDRPIVTTRDFDRSIGKLVEITLDRHLDKRLKLEGYLKSFDDNHVTIIRDDPFLKGVKPKTNGQELSVPRELIRVVKGAVRI